jgi:hypothetical protein
MATMLVISGAMLLTLLAMQMFFRYSPPEMSEVGLRHFRAGFVFSSVSAAALLGAFALPYAMEFFFTPYQCQRLHFLLVVIFYAGNLCNVIAILYFFRELLPGGEITPEGMSAGLAMCIEQVLWILFGIGVVLVDF